MRLPTWFFPELQKSYQAGRKDAWAAMDIIKELAGGEGTRFDLAVHCAGDVPPSRRNERAVAMASADWWYVYGFLAACRVMLPHMKIAWHGFSNKSPRPVPKREWWQINYVTATQL